MGKEGREGEEETMEGPGPCVDLVWGLYRDGGVEYQGGLTMKSPGSGDSFNDSI